MNDNLKSAFFSANLHYFLPHISKNSSQEIFKRWKSYHTSNSYMNISFPEMDRLKKSPVGVIALYHLGSHLQIINYLALVGIKFDILITKGLTLKYQTYFNSLIEKNKLSFQPKFLDAQDPYVLLKVRNSILEQRYVIIFVDGFVGSVSKSKDLLPVNFFRKKLYVRKGIAFISFILSLNIYPIIQRNNGQNTVLLLESTIRARPNENKDEYAERCMNYLFYILKRKIKDKLHLWECWSYLHRYHTIQIDTSSSRKIAPKSEMKKINIGHKTLYFDISNYRFFE